VVKRADKRCPKGNRRKKDNFQFINQIGFCENDNRSREEFDGSGLFKFAAMPGPFKARSTLSWKIVDSS
jgi:hypothetical protein